MELSAHYQKITELSERMSILSEHLKLEEKKDRLEEVKLELENPDVWSDPDKDRKSTRLNSSHSQQSRMPSSA